MSGLNDRLNKVRASMRHKGYGVGSLPVAYPIAGLHSKYKANSEPSLIIQQGNRKPKPITLPKPKIPEAYND